MKAADYIGREERLEGALDPDRRDDRVVAQAVVVQRVDAVGEHHDLPPDDPAPTEGEVEEVLAIEADVEQRACRALRSHTRSNLGAERGLGGRGAARELTPAEEGERGADPARHVDVDPEPVACLALLDVVRLEIDAQVRMRLDASPKHGRE